MALCFLSVLSGEGIGQTLSFLFRNARVIEGTPPRFQYEVWLRSSDGTEKMGSLLVYNNYNPLAFGPNIVGNEKVTLAQDTVNFPSSSGYYQNAANDNTSSRFAFSWTHVVTGSEVVIPSTGDGMLAFTVSIDIEDTLQSSNIEFDTLMNDQQYTVDELPGGRWSTLDLSDAMDVLLPVTLSAFTASRCPEGSAVMLEWSTATETNSYGFEIDRRSIHEESPGSPFSAARDWLPLGFVPAAGASASPQHYTYEDRSAKWNRYAYRLKEIDRDGTYRYSHNIEIESLVPTQAILEQNHPNPFNPSTTIRFALPRLSHVSLRIYNPLGQEVATLADGEMNAGYHELRFDATALASGVYLYRLQTEEFVETRKLVLVK